MAIIISACALNFVFSAGVCATHFYDKKKSGKSMYICAVYMYVCTVADKKVMVTVVFNGVYFAFRWCPYPFPFVLAISVAKKQSWPSMITA